MKKENTTWKISRLQTDFRKIEFPEFQREPTVWSLDQKRLLIDSIFRGYDISSIYLFRNSENGDDRYECIDGRQRLNAILSFLGLNEVKESDNSISFDNGFAFKSKNEIVPTEILSDIDGKRFVDLHNEGLGEKIEAFLEYEFNVLEITEVDEDWDLNLMFARLQGGSSLNPGEKLRAMRGEMRNEIFGKENGIGQHEFFTFLSIPKRRYAREQVAVQLVMNFFSLEASGEFRRARFVDLQGFLGEKVVLSEADRETLNLFRVRLDEVTAFLKSAEQLKLNNRALGVSVFFFISDLIDKDRKDEIPMFLNFLVEFLTLLKEEIAKGIDIDPKWRELLRFQTYVSQAAVEKYAIDSRAKLLEGYFEHYKTNQGKIVPIADQPGLS